MSDTSAPQGTGPATTPQQPASSGPQLRALNQFVKDLSFENPGARTNDDRPNIDLGIDVSAIPHEQGNGLYEVSLKLTAKAHTTTTTLFLLELDYAGMFQVVGMREADAEAALLIECPRLLFPFARRLIADITREGGFPPLLIDPVDFVQLYQSQKQRDQGGSPVRPQAAPQQPASQPMTQSASPQHPQPAAPAQPGSGEPPQS